jgi:hypothetical protein
MSLTTLEGSMSMLADAIEAAGKWLDRNDGEAERHDRAVEAVLRALNQTKAYIADCATGRQRVREHQLVEFWTKAAVAVRRSDPSLARRLQLKAEYWADPENWSERDLELARIKIRDISRLAHGDLLLEPDE